MTKKIAILGSTGSIGVQALEVIEGLGYPDYQVCALTANSSVEKMEEQVRKFRPSLAVMADDASASELRLRLRDTGTKVASGAEGLCMAAGLPEADLVLNAVVGIAGLIPTLTAVEAGKDIALANKETLVTGGALVKKLAREKNVKIYPVDSEHSAIFQCLQGAYDKKQVSHLILTASGGPFFGKKFCELENMTREQALHHPNWSMGAKVTIDSATMMNKGLELIEAVWLFDMPPQAVDILVHRESIVHSLIEFQDGSLIAQMGLPDMRLPIQYALTYPDRFPSSVPRCELSKVGQLTFFPPDEKTFPAIDVCRRAIVQGGTKPAAVNGANERAVELFLKGKIKFTDITSLVSAAAQCGKTGKYTLNDILAADRHAREYVDSLVK